MTKKPSKVDVKKYADLRKKLKKLEEECQTIGLDFFKEESKDLFEQNPDLYSFSWTQYTPYFNDGDACEFSAHTEYPDVNGMDEWGDGNDEEGTHLSEKRRKTLCKQVVEFLSQFDEDDLRKWFDDHVMIYVTREGVTVNSYDHE